MLVAGCGWLGRAVGRELSRRGDRVIGIRRDPAAGTELERDGIRPLIVDLATVSAARSLPGGVDAVIACPAPADPGVEAYRRSYVDAVATLVDRYAAELDRAFVYTGSTGVFGQRDGGQVDERSPTLPTSPTAGVLVEAEQLVLASGVGSIVRLSGLYGPSRYGVIDRVRNGRLALGPADGRFMNFCHLDDAVRSVVAAIDRGRPGTVYHASDAEPTRRREVIRWIAARAGFDPTVGTGDDAAEGPDRRVSAVWSREALGVELAYPSFRDGLADAISRAC
ncbi:MAG TPA: NAD-dependent epimerase/dehydratase family protein [Candidatus Polarisedimenticolaceae bacterium]|nr:NAD-dependent epimerase/dehydratase family protein [Candidatus Polarisedimenticolaceae bacterium]